MHYSNPSTTSQSIERELRVLQIWLITPLQKWHKIQNMKAMRSQWISNAPLMPTNQVGPTAELLTVPPRCKPCEYSWIEESCYLHLSSLQHQIKGLSSQSTRPSGIKCDWQRDGCSPFHILTQVCKYTHVGSYCGPNVSHFSLLVQTGQGELDLQTTMF